MLSPEQQAKLAAMTPEDRAELDLVVEVVQERLSATGGAGESVGKKKRVLAFAALATATVAALATATVAAFSGPSGKEVAELKSELAATKQAAIEVKKEASITLAEVKTELTAAKTEAGEARRIADEAKGLAQAPKPAPQPPTAPLPGAPSAPSLDEDIAACVKDLTGSGAKEAEAKKACGG